MPYIQRASDLTDLRYHLTLESLVDLQLILGEQICLGTPDSNTKDNSNSNHNPSHFSALAIASDN